MEEHQLYIKSDDSIYRAKQSICLWDGDERMANFWSEWLEFFETDGANYIMLLSLVWTLDPLW